MADTTELGLERPREPTEAEREHGRQLFEAWRASRVAPLGAPDQAPFKPDDESEENLRLLKQQGYAGE